MIRAVLDTNVIVSGIIKGASPPGRGLESLFKQRFIAVTTSALLMEVARVLAYPRISRKYRVGEETADALMTSLVLLSDVVRVQKASVRMSRDPDDDRLLACAVQGKADYVVTGDEDLLDLRSFREIPILPPAAFLGVLEAAS